VGVCEVVSSVLEGAPFWWDPGNCGSQFGHWKRGEVETYWGMGGRGVASAQGALIGEACIAQMLMQ
jgi:hypothetical protein